MLEQLSLHTPVCVIHRRRPYSEQKLLGVAAIIKLVEAAMIRASNLKSSFVCATQFVTEKETYVSTSGVDIGIGN